MVFRRSVGLDVTMASMTVQATQISMALGHEHGLWWLTQTSNICMALGGNTGHKPQLQ